MAAGSPQHRPNISRRPARRGVTLVEMLVVVALVVLMMTILVQIFQSATGAMSASKATQDLDVTLRQIDSMIRADLNGVTAKMTPPNDPALKTGYFEYGENAPADAQGEDTDDYIAFTVKAPEGQVFTGRQVLSASNSPNRYVQPINVTSQVAEVIYFLRNGNLYRRVFLVTPDRGTTLFNPSEVDSVVSQALDKPGFRSTIFGNLLSVSYLGLNEISARPGPSTGTYTPIANDLGDLTNRENRAFRPRFCDDFNVVDGIPDDNNGDGIADYYPTLYYDGVGHFRNGSDGSPVDWVPNNLILNGLSHEKDFPSNGAFRVEHGTVASYDVYAFPFIYPGMYSVPDGATLDGSGNVTPPSTGLGLRHGLLPYNDPTLGLVINHAPVQGNDNLPLGGIQTWWGFPTWRETMAGNGSGGGVGWRDPISLPNRVASHRQAIGLQQANPTSTYALSNANFLPPIYTPNSNVPVFSFDGAGSASFVADPLAKGSSQSVYPNPLWEDDLILTGVRSFNVRAYDIDAPLYNYQAGDGTYTNGPFSSGYQDLGYGVEHGFGAAAYAYGPNGAATTTSPVNVPWQAALSEPTGFGHSGRIPPLYSDYRVHPRRPVILNDSGSLVPNVVGDNSAGIIRLNRVWDSWSTDYTNAPDSDVFLNQYSSQSQSIYPSFPPPYPSPLRGIEIQIRLTDPRGERPKALTIRHDFTDKL